MSEVWDGSFEQRLFTRVTDWLDACEDTNGPAYYALCTVHHELLRGFAVGELSYSVREIGRFML